MTIHRFDDFEFDSDADELTRLGRPVRLRPQASRALKLLLERSNRLVSREQLKSAIWGSTVVEWETGIHQVIRQLRRALDDDPRAPRFIETVPTRGYRFRPPPEAAVPAAPAATARSRYRDVVFFVLGFLGLPALILLACSFLAA